MNEIISACRLCFNANRNNINIFDENGTRMNVAKILSKHFWFEVNENDDLPNVICTECWSTTYNFHTFYGNIQLIYNDKITVKNANAIHSDGDIKFNNGLDEEHRQQQDSMIDVKTILNDDGDGGGNTEPVFIKHEIDVSINAMENLDLSYVNAGIMKETDQLMGYQNSDNFEFDYLERGETSKNLFSSDEEQYEHREISRKSSKHRKTKLKKNIRKCKIQKVKSKKIINKDGVVVKRAYNKTNLTSAKVKIEKSKLVKEQIEQTQSEQNAQIREYFKMECDLCVFKFSTFLDAQVHYRSEHQIIGYLLCCGKKFVRRGRMMDHISRHLNPNAYKCSLCNKIYADKFALKNHIITHEISNENKPFQCVACPQRFMKKFQLSHHLKYRHCKEEDKIYICDICTKSFISKCLLKSHIKNVHQNANAQICDICAKVFKSKQILASHRALHLKDTVKRRLQCNICGSWLAHEHSLRSHLARHKDVAHSCPKCGKLTPNRQSLGSHMRYVHAERNHICTLCNKAFKKAIGLKEHMASHTGETLYTCPHCPKTFKSGANMHSHRKKAHPVEWAQNRLKRTEEYYY